MVTLVTPPVKLARSPRIPAENEETLFTTEAANAEPGRDGMEILPPPPDDGAGTEPIDVAGWLETVDVGRKVGSYRHHQEGAGINTGPEKVRWVRSS